MTLTERRLRFRKVLEGKDCIFPASVHDAVSARIAESLGFEICMLAGSTASAAVLGAPDLVVLTLTEFAEQARRITRYSSLSLMVDADHGYGNALNVMRTVEELEAAGVCALTIEDTLLPQPFGRGKSEELISVEELSGKLKGALEARQDPSLVIVGRTSAPRIGGMGVAVARAKACAETGVDAVFFVGVKSREEVEAIRQATALPIILGTIPQSLSDRSFLGDHGVRIALQGHVPFQTTVKSLYETYKHLQEGGFPADLKDQAASSDLMKLALREADYVRWRRDYLGES